MTVSRTLGIALLLAVLPACKFGGSDSSPNISSTAPNNPSSSIPEPEPIPIPIPIPEPEPEPLAYDQYSLADGCFQLKRGEQFISADSANAAYGVSDDQQSAAKFFFKATQLETYLLQSAYERETDKQSWGTKELLGITDGPGEMLDQFGNFIGEAGVLVRAIGDIANYLVDPVAISGQAPPGDHLAAGGNAISSGGHQVSDDNIAPELAMVTRANDLAVWRLAQVETSEGSEEFIANVFTLASEVTGNRLAVQDGTLGLTAAGSVAEIAQFEVVPAEGCAAYPEVSTNAQLVSQAGPAIYLKDVPAITPLQGQFDNDDIYGFVDTHAHISAYEFIGGRINYGDPYHKFGVEHALENCDANHGPNGFTGFTAAVTSGPPPHETRGWPDFPFWPVHNNLMHHQTYYKWIERAFLAGQKILVNHLVHNEVLCQLDPNKQNSCDAMPAIEIQARAMHSMQDYIDAQNGGPGKGWFQIVTSPDEARRVIADGKMAVILGLEMSKPLNCGEFLDQAECTYDQVIERLNILGGDPSNDEDKGLGVVSMFPTHKFDNAFGGHLLDTGGLDGNAGILYMGNFAETGHPIEYEDCPEEEYTGIEENPGGPPYRSPPSDQESGEAFMTGIIDQLLLQMTYLAEAFPGGGYDFPDRDRSDLCNSRGLTELGAQLIDELISRKWFIETDHISRKAAARILDITDARAYPVVNSHGGWGGPNSLRDRIAVQGGFSSDFPAGSRNGWADRLNRDGGRQRDARYTVAGYGGSGYGTDVNGMASLPGSLGDENADDPLYPFTSVDGRVLFDVQVTGDHAFTPYSDRGIAHYGLFADKIADMQKYADNTDGKLDKALGQLFTSAEAYIRMWERMEATGE